ncbi:hypothetical protein [Egbenema bharatensis]|uniref:hypothetical protein n=1 Tax=Egbenema bharatensis TaxID=3463334 RepID=UPI003A8BD9A6
MNLTLLAENFLFFAIATTFFVLVGWAWRNAKPYDLPQPLPDWFKIWFLTVQIGGGVVPLVALIWALWQGYSAAMMVLVSYFIMLVLQIVSESVSLRRFRSVVFVMVPYLYLPYRIWQLYQGMLLNPTDELFRNFLLAEIVLWTLNYALDLSQLPRLLRWDMKEEVN